MWLLPRHTVRPGEWQGAARVAWHGQRARERLARAWRAAHQLGWSSYCPPIGWCYNRAIANRRSRWHEWARCGRPVGRRRWPRCCCRRRSWWDGGHRCIWLPLGHGAHRNAAGGPRSTAAGKGVIVSHKGRSELRTQHPTHIRCMLGPAAKQCHLLWGPRLAGRVLGAPSGLGAALLWAPERHATGGAQKGLTKNEAPRGPPHGGRRICLAEMALNFPIARLWACQGPETQAYNDMYYDHSIQRPKL
jgi:hypothetical protein